MIRGMRMMVHRCQMKSQSKTCRLFTTPATAGSLDPKLAKIVEDIALLNLIEASELVSALKDVIMAATTQATSAAPVAEAEETKATAPTQFKVTLAKFDPATKAKVIKEIKALIPGANLVEAKKFVEGAPKVIKDNCPKEEAEKIKKILEAVGATVTLE